MKHTLLLSLSLLLSAHLAFAQSAPSSDSIPPMRKIIDYTIDEKVIYVNELGLPPNTPLSNALLLSPEFLGRDLDAIINNFDVQIDDISVGAGRYNTLMHMLISEVDHVEITTDPSYSESSNSLGGVIDIIMKKAPEGVDGQASLDLTTDLGVSPYANISYKKDKLTIHGTAYLKYYDFMSRELDRADSREHYDYTLRESFKKGFNEGVKFGLIYNFTERDKLTFWALQNYETTRDSSAANSALLYDNPQRTYDGGIMTSFNPIEKSEIDAILKYERFYSRPSQKLFISLSYDNSYDMTDSYLRYSGSQFSSMDYSLLQDKYTTRPNNAKLSAYYRFHLLPAESEHTLRLKAGFTASLNVKSGTQNTLYVATDSAATRYPYTFNDYTTNVTVIPYAIFFYDWRVLSMELGVRYRFRGMFSRGENSDWQQDYFHNFVGNFNVTYKPSLSHQLRASTSRTIVSPNNVQLYGNMFLNTTKGWLQKGNPSLRESVLNNVDLMYLYHYRNARHDLQLTFAVEYVNAQDLIEACVTSASETSPSYHTWSNADQTKHIVDGRLSIFWQTNIFSLSFCANAYDKITPAHDDVRQKDEFYYNLSLQPILHFEHDWVISSTFVYNSKYYQGSTVVGDALNLNMNVSKAWGPWSVRLNFYNMFDYLSQDVTTTSTGVTNKYYHQYHCQFLAGFTYCFGTKWKNTSPL